MHVLLAVSLQRSIDCSAEANIKQLFKYTDACPTAEVVVRRLATFASRHASALSGLTKHQLVQLLKAYHIKGLSRLSKPQLVHRLSCVLEEKTAICDEQPLLSLMERQT